MNASLLQVGLGVIVFTGIVLVLVSAILAARSRLVQTGPVTVLVNDERELQLPAGVKLMVGLADAGILLPSACGGGGTCGQCRLKVDSGGGPLLPTETSLINRRDARDHVRLACQVPVRSDMQIHVPPEIFGVRSFECTVVSNDNVASFIKELVLEVPSDEDFTFRAGGYVLIESPACRLRFRDFEIAERFRAEWDRHDLWRYEAAISEPTTRAYSMANDPLEQNLIKLNVRIATPPPGADAGVPAGKVSSYIFALEPGDTVSVQGPFGHFFATDTDNEMVFIGGGAGMAPMRSLIRDQLLRLNTRRKMTFWYGARSRNETFYTEDFDALAAANDNFDWHLALSDPAAGDDWQGYTGFIHQVLYDEYLASHRAPEDAEYYICGPPVMNTAVLNMLDDLGVGEDHIFLDDFGA